MFTGSTAPTTCTSTTNRTAYSTVEYDADRTELTDPAAKVREEYRDALGRLTSVMEAPGSLNVGASYEYDPLGNLLLVTQEDDWAETSQTREFVYSSLGQLISADNPESGEITYTYNDDGSLDAITDARSVETSFTYDALGRIRTKSYSDATPDVTFNYYTGSAPNIGRLQSVVSSAATETFNGYDTLGRVLAHTQTIAGNPNAYTLAYTYRLDDSIDTMTYPSGREIAYEPDPAGRLETVSDGTTDYLTADGSDYDALGRLAAMELGNGLYESRQFRPAGTATSLKLGTSAGGSQKLNLEYSYSATQNNGNLTGQVITHPGPTTYTQSYAYDAANRLSMASETSGFFRAYGYDDYGNRWISQESGVPQNYVYEPTSSSNFDEYNQINVGDADHDAAGNQVHFAHLDLTFDAENRLTAAESTEAPNDDEAAFAYDGSGRRVMKSWDPYGGSEVVTYYVYDIAGRMAAEYSDQTLPSPETSYIFTDLLGSIRMVTDESGNVDECYDYLPFGRMLTTGENGRSSVGCYPSSPTAYASDLGEKFTGQIRDETRLDYFLARFYADGQGRFTSAEPLSGWTADPQSWNRYAYARNNPLRYLDPLGLEYTINRYDSETGFLSWSRHFSGLHEDLDYAAFALQWSALGYDLPGIGASGWGCHIDNMDDCLEVIYTPGITMPTDVEERILEAVPIAVRMLLEERQCRGLFISNGNDPFLRPGRFSVARITPTNPNVQSAQINAMIDSVGLRSPDFGMRVNQWVMVINNEARTEFNRGDPTTRALTLIHELGHIWSQFGLGTSVIRSDDMNSDSGLADSDWNRAEVRDRCL